MIYSKLELSGGMPYANLSIRNLNAQVDCSSSKSPKFEGLAAMPNAHLSIRNLNSQVECRLPILAIEI